MAKRTYAIIGATGHIGHVVVHHLLKKGHLVRAIGRDEKKLISLQNQGAETIRLQDFDRESPLIAACKGADALLSFIAPAYNQEDFTSYQDLCSEAIVAAIQKNHIPYVVNISSIGAELPAGTGPIKGLFTQEERLNALSSVHVFHLRPSYFMENLLWSIRTIKETGVFKGVLKGDVPIPMIATKDIGLKAAELLDHLHFREKTIFDFLGPEEISLNEAAGIIGQAIGKPNLTYVQEPYLDAEQQLIRFGMNRTSAHLLMEMWQAVNEGDIVPTQKITPAHRGATTFQEFAKTFAAIYNTAKDKAKTS